MQKLIGKGIVILHKSCRVIHKETNKIEFTFFDLSIIFYEFSKNQQKLSLFKIHFTSRPLERFWNSHIYPRFAEKTLERPRALQCGPWGGWQRERLDSIELAAVLGRRSGGEGPHAREGLICGQNWGANAGGELGRGDRRRRLQERLLQ
jgi:hypothetical protein